MKFFDRAAVAAILADGIKELKLDLDDAQHDKLLDYLALLFKWNAVYNLTSVRDPLQMVTHHLLDSLARCRRSRRRSACSTWGRAVACRAWCWRSPGPTCEWP